MKGWFLHKSDKKCSDQSEYFLKTFIAGKIINKINERNSVTCVLCWCILFCRSFLCSIKVCCVEIIYILFFTLLKPGRGYFFSSRREDGLLKSNKMLFTLLFRKVYRNQAKQLSFVLLALAAERSDGR